MPKQNILIFSDQELQVVLDALSNFARKFANPVITNISNQLSVHKKEATKEEKVEEVQQ